MIPDTGDGSTAFPTYSDPYEPLPPVAYDPALVAGMEQMRRLFEPVPLRPDNLVWSRAHVDRLVPPDGDPLATAPDAPVEIREVTIPGVDGHRIVLTLVTPGGAPPAAGRPGAYVIHGGGMVLGNRMMAAGAAIRFAVEHDAVAASVEYRLAPEHPWPAGVEDCYSGLAWFADHAAELGFDPERILVTGSSAGGGLSAAMGLLARERRSPRLLALHLDAPMIDDRNASASTRQYDRLGVWDRNNNQTAWEALLGERRGGDDVHWSAAPNRASDLAGLPPTLITVGSAEIFREEAIEYAQRIWAAGGDCELYVSSGGHHGFGGFSPDTLVSRSADEVAQNWYRRVLGEPAPSGEG